MNADDGMASGVTIRVNGRRQALEVQCLAELLTELGHGPDATGIAVALNGEVVPRAAWVRTGLREGDAVEIVGAVQGG